ncbi:hypothetical protein CAFE_22710 [Caprobacter fermentans]|uniref:Uncharacterized protein n=1 Tax=Caproicibacter fermentans TaxID=2576756 RepID=A0A6N8I0L1_9FIRM|nr:hypothetical protein [Caproicibacter fermentans]MVB11552.1 hypothetical protein [Caproicibacter fermentans]OCN02746.1 hypothetical protein A7X67_14355 [Clostridium sp. W14A]QNK41067.1 hypothetical protein HCR03_01770 [Caproicibacter fermentans]
MLGKLLKYEFKATARTFLPIYGLILVLAIINKLFWNQSIDNFEIPRMISMSVYIMLIVAAFVITLVVTIQRFNKNLLGDEGYLSFTLPVKAHYHIDSKMIVTLIWSALSIIVSAVSVFIMVVNPEVLTQFSRMCADLAEVYRQYGLSAHLIAIEIIILIILGFLSNIVEIYAAIVVGNLAGRHKLLAGIGAYLGFGIVEQIVTSLLFSGFNRQIEEYFQSFHYSNNLFPAEPAEVALLVMILYTAVFGVAFYFFTNWMLTRKLNLE